METKYLCEIKADSGNMSNLKTIQTIKQIRESTGCVLLQAKNVVQGDRTGVVRKAIMSIRQIEDIAQYMIPRSIRPDELIGEEYPVMYLAHRVDVRGRVLHGPQKTGYVIKILDVHDHVPF
tara:strand:+ start:488 stop:850 length:363 start_codon:yes stop_codon:yes gene_type:complete